MQRNCVAVRGIALDARAPCSFALLRTPLCNFCYFCYFCYFVLLCAAYCQYPQPSAPACSKLALQVHAPDTRASLLRKGVRVKNTALSIQAGASERQRGISECAGYG